MTCRMHSKDDNGNDIYIVAKGAIPYVYKGFGNPCIDSWGVCVDKDGDY